MKKNNKASKVKLVIFGVDGVLTDGGMFFSASGDELRRFHRRDALGLDLLKRYDIKSAIISSISSPITKRWAEEFKVDFILLGTANKLHEYEKLLIRSGLQPEEAAYISDDIDELEILSRVGFPVTVADGADANKQASAYVTRARGGYGAVRETIETILYSQG